LTEDIDQQNAVLRAEITGGYDIDHVISVERLGRSIEKFFQHIGGPDHQGNHDGEGGQHFEK